MKFSLGAAAREKRKTYQRVLMKFQSLLTRWCKKIKLNIPSSALSIFRCIHITDIGVGYISTMISLNGLFMRWCSQIRDFGLQHLCSMRNLQVLSLAGCPLLTSSGLSSIIQLRHLQELELTNCAGASQELFAYLREHLPRCLIIE
jgi:F-box/leucine-rich repeat protein 16